MPNTQTLFPRKTALKSPVAHGKANARSIMEQLDIGCPEVLHERPSFTVPQQPIAPFPEWYI